MASSFFSKGVYPYSYTEYRSKFDEVELPPILPKKTFTTHLTTSHFPYKITNALTKYGFFFGIKNIQHYHDHYLLSDVLLLRARYAIKHIWRYTVLLSENCILRQKGSENTPDMLNS